MFPRWFMRNLRIEHVDIVRQSLLRSSFLGSAGCSSVVSESQVISESKDGRLFFLWFFGFGFKFAEWETIDRGEVIDRMKFEREAMTRALMDVNSSPSGSLLTVSRLLAG